MATYDFTWEVTNFDANTGICHVTYTPKDEKLTVLTTSLKITNTDELANTIVFSVPVYDWDRQKNQIDANTVIGMTGKASTEYL